MVFVVRRFKFYKKNESKMLKNRSRSTKMLPKWSQNGSRMVPEAVMMASWGALGGTPPKYRSRIDFGTTFAPKWLQFCPKMVPKSIQNRSSRQNGSQDGPGTRSWSQKWPNCLQFGSQNGEKMDQKSNKKRYEIRYQFFIDFGCDFDEFLIPKWHQIWRKIEAKLNIIFERLK